MLSRCVAVAMAAQLVPSTSGFATASTTAQSVFPSGICSEAREVDAYWDDLADHRQEHFQRFGWTRERWDHSYNTTEFAEYRFGLGFDPTKVKLSIPELDRIDFQYLSSALADVQIELRDGDLVGEDEFTPRHFVSMGEFIGEMQRGSNLYLKYDENEVLKQNMQSTIGTSVLTHLVDAIEAAGLFPGSLCSREQTADKWTFWVGGTNTSTGMHYDDDEFGFLYVATGRKRVVLIPNDEQSASTYGCETYIEGHSCWTGVDILHGVLPPRAVEIELGPGEGIVIPVYAWHAVQNLEPTIAFGLLLEDNIFC